MDSLGLTEVLLIVGGLAVLVGFGFVVSWAASRVYDEVTIGRRIAKISGEQVDLGAGRAFQKEEADRVEAVIDRLLPSLMQTRSRLRKAGIKVGVQLYLLALLGVTAVLSLRYPLPLIPPAGLPLVYGLGLHVLVDRLVLSMLIERRRTKTLAQLPNAIDYIARGVAVGQSLDSAVGGAAGAVEAPLSEHFGTVSRLARFGVPLIDALETTGKEIDLQEFDFFVAACGAQMGTGGNLVSVLQSLSETIRQREILLQKVKALSAEGRMSAWVLSIFPILLLLYFNHANPEYVEPMYTTTLGNILLALGAVLVLVGGIVMARLVKIKV